MSGAEKIALEVLERMEAKSRRMSQNQKILSHLVANGGITQREAARAFECYRLAPRIFELRRKGVPIITEMVYEDGVGYAKYRLEDDYAGL